jgi:hypothetical protein
MMDILHRGGRNKVYTDSGPLSWYMRSGVRDDLIERQTTSSECEFGTGWVLQDGR